MNQCLTDFGTRGGLNTADYKRQDIFFILANRQSRRLLTERQIETNIVCSFSTCFLLENFLIQHVCVCTPEVKCVPIYLPSLHRHSTAILTINPANIITPTITYTSYPPPPFFLFFLFKTNPKFHHARREQQAQDPLSPRRRRQPGHSPVPSPQAQHPYRPPV